MKDGCPLCGAQHSSDCVVCKENTTSMVLDASQLIEVGKTDKRKVSPLNKELYDLAVATMTSANPYGEGLISEHGVCWHIGFRDVSEFINELEKRYDITPKTDGDNV